MAALSRNRRHGMTPEEEGFQAMGNSLAAEDPYQLPEPRMPRSVSSDSPEGQMFSQRQPLQRSSVPGMQAPASTLGPNLSQQVSNTQPTQMMGRASSAPPVPSYQARDTAGMANTLGPSLSTRANGGFVSPQAQAGMMGSMQGSSPQAPMGNSGYTLSNMAGAGSGANSYSGFDFNQDAGNRDTGKSAKYAFADLAGKSGVPMPTTKQGAEEWARQYIVPGMNALGHNVLDVKGDKMLVSNWQGEGWVDFLQNADGSNPMLAWQAEGSSGSPAMGAGGPMGMTNSSDPYATLSNLQTGAMQGDTYSQRVLYYLMQQLGLDQSLMNGAMPQGA
jgi:hypothetical protein